MAGEIINKNVLADIQAEMKVGKNQRNTFGKYNYRSAEDILEAAKKVCNPRGFAVVCSDELKLIGDRYYIEATASIFNKETDQYFQATGLAREEESKKGMDGSQVTGASSSYARKYAMNGLFAIDDTKDSDGTNDHGKVSEPSEPKPKTVQLKPLTKDKLELVIDFIVGGKTMDDVEKKYTVSDAMKATINAEVKARIAKKENK